MDRRAIGSPRRRHRESEDSVGSHRRGRGGHRLHFRIRVTRRSGTPAPRAASGRRSDTRALPSARKTSAFRTPTSSSSSRATRSTGCSRTERPARLCWRCSRIRRSRRRSPCRRYATLAGDRAALEALDRPAVQALFANSAAREALTASNVAALLPSLRPHLEDAMRSSTRLRGPGLRKRSQRPAIQTALAKGNLAAMRAEQALMAFVSNPGGRRRAQRYRRQDGAGPSGRRQGPGRCPLCRPPCPTGLRMKHLSRSRAWRGAWRCAGDAWRWRTRR